MPLTEADTTRIPLFQDMTPGERQSVLGRLEAETYGRGETILREGKSTQILWVIVGGRCEVVKARKNGGDQQLAVLEAGAVFGEMSFFNPAPHSASVRTLTEVEVARLSRESFEGLFASGCSAAFRLTANTARILAERLLRMDDWICDLVERPEAKQHRDEWRDFRTRLYNEWQF